MATNYGYTCTEFDGANDEGIQPKPPPRFTEYLRNSSDVYHSHAQGQGSSRRFKPLNTTEDPGAFISIQEHKRLRLKRSVNRQEEWSSVLEFLKSNTHPERWKSLTRDFDEFTEISKEFSTLSALPTDQRGITEETALLLLNLFFNGRVETSDSVLPTQKQVSNLKEYFGKVNQQLINKSCQAFHSLISHVDPLTQSQLKDTIKKLSKKSSEATLDWNSTAINAILNDPNIFPFGKFKIELFDPSAAKDNLEICPDHLYSLDEGAGAAARDYNGQDTLTEEDRKVFALFADENLALATIPEAAPTPSSSKSSSTTATVPWDRSYLLNLIGNQDILEALIQIINSTHTNDQIQDQLFDLLGFEKLDLITQILENRGTIIKALAKEEAVAIAIRNRVKKNAGASATNPVIGVLIQSAEEKMLEKIYRKEDKKASKAAAAYVASGGEFTTVSQDEINLGKSMLNKVSSSYMRPMANGALEDNPNIYDSYAEVKQKAGFISGQKIVLPDNMVRKQTNECEEVEIPAEKKTLPKRALEKELIKISSLDPMGQQVFRGMKELNRIQTIVFETAYKTNENLLICAPTGAGKTNIALLTVLHCIKNNMEGDAILKNQFKIVYVAPMKALAAEMTSNFSKRLSPLGISVRELTGDMQLTKAEITQTQMIVTTPEKWDVVTRKSTGDVALAQIVKLIIIDEVHLLHGDRGPVVESLVARTLRQVESSQRMIRIVGLSATLPNYRDVAQFLRVNPKVGLFYFDGRFRPVPLGSCFIGVKALSMMEQQRQMDVCCYDKVYDMVSKGHQVMVFVHARNATIKTAEILIEIASKKGQLESFMVRSSDDEPFAEYGKALKSLEKSRNKKLGELFQSGFSVHHAGLLRTDRNLVEKLFSDGYIKVLVCTATLAWGVNLPAHAVIIKGTEIYDAKQGSFVDLGILDVLQIFGRAGRPQFDTDGHGTIITTHDKLAHYLSLLTNQFPIESNFIKFLADNLNAEVALGSASNIDEAVEWLTYTYLYVRMRRNPQLYGMLYTEAQDDPLLTIRRKELIVEAARSLESARMIRFDERTENLYATDLGRTASHYYIKYDTIIVFNDMFHPVMPMDGILNLICNASEFEQLKVRDEELDELDNLKDYCMLKVWGGSENVHGKVSILIQTYVSRGFIKSFSLMSDQQYVIQNAIRICRGFFEIVLRQGNPILAGRLLEFSKMLDLQLWDGSHPLRQHKILSQEILEKLEKFGLNFDRLRELEAGEIGSLVRHPKMGPIIKRCVEELPFLEVSVDVQPITRNVLRVRIHILPSFKWNDRLHGNVSESFWIWVEDSENNTMYHHEYFLITKKQVLNHTPQELVFTIPITDPLPTQYYIRIVSDRFLGSQTIPVSFKHLILPEQHPPHTTLLDLDPLPTSALKDTRLELLYPFQFYNPIQTQIFHCLYHTDTNALIGAPTGSGKTIAAEMAMFRVFRVYPNTKVVYIAPLKALVRERMNDWKTRLEIKLNKKVVELTGDVTPDVRAIASADVIVTTPEKWDGISRSWQTRTYVQDVSLIIIDEIHLLGEDRGPVLEVIVSRTNFISKFTDRTLRVVGLSTALANARDLADWLGIKGFNGLFNFRPSVRPVPIQVHIQGFPGKHYCPRMATMNKPSYQAIREHSPCKPVLIFVSSRRQTRLTALDLIAYLAADGHPKQWIRNMDDSEMEYVVAGVKEPNLKLTLSFGIGIHHAGLQESDRKVVEELFVNQKIQVLIATATLAWGVNFPAHLVIIKGTEYYDGKTHRYVDMPITDVLQMMGRAGRPQFDTEGVAVVLVHDQKKNFYKKFLYEPFPVESSLLEVLPDHLNAEIVAGTISSNQEALDYLTYTYFFRRLLQNPSYYHLESNEPEAVNSYMSNLVGRAFQVLENASCIYIHDDLRTVEPTSFGRIAGYYYLSHQTMEHFRNSLRPNLSRDDLLHVMTRVQEYAELPVRHNEDKLNEELAKELPIEVQAGTFDSPHTKAHLLLQSHFSRIQLPCSDYYTDLKSVLDQAIRVLQAMIDACAEKGWLVPVLHSINLMQMIIQARWIEDDAFICLPHIDELASSALIQKFQVDTLPELQAATRQNSEMFERILLPFLDQPSSVQFAYKILHELPAITVTIDADLEQRKVPLPINNSNTWTDLPADKDFTLFLNLKRENSFPKDLRVYAPKFSKIKDESWFIVLGDVETQEVIALKRAGGVKRTLQQQLKIDSLYSTGRKIYTLYLMSDAYLGIDYQYSLRLNFV